ncbi:putative late blight resistance protein homolog R1B-19 [Ipomoea triloba]|uniref:putative late blight resistance protein homolog R1B-19 n=1 Tax=Ipomoea triloba TaxID=35885 RepID=UPI00125D286A|nr:putative late blight resistance protein homolog R1B-19 [Ipomoea triloba]
MAAFVVVTSLLELVEQQLLQPKPCLVLHDTETIVSLRDKLYFLQAFLEESELKPEDPEAKEELESEIQDVATKAEGQIESKLRLLYLAANANGGDECFVEEACQQLYQTIQQVLKDIKAVEVRILMLKPNFLFTSSTNDIKEENIIFGVSSPRPSDLIPQDTPIVGFDNDARTLVDWLTNGLMERRVIPIWGMGGLGKTTLAKMVYEDPEVRYHFHIRAQAVVSREHNVKEMLIQLLDCILPVTTEISNKGEAELAEQLRKSLVGKRIVFGDERWKPDPYFESLGRSISILCVGIPLVAVLIAGLLATVNNSLEIWEDVRETLRTAQLRHENNNLEAITSLCYNYLPNHLKACFLYFGVFPEDSSIPFTKLINLWVAEGFLKPERNRSLEEVAKSYLYDLINRNLVQIDKRSVDGKINRCKIHDRVHEMCVREAKKKNIMSLLNEKFLPFKMQVGAPMFETTKSIGFIFT